MALGEDAGLPSLPQGILAVLTRPPRGAPTGSDEAGAWEHCFPSLLFRGYSYLKHAEIGSSGFLASVRAEHPSSVLDQYLLTQHVAAVHTQSPVVVPSGKPKCSQEIVPLAMWCVEGELG